MCTIAWVVATYMFSYICLIFPNREEELKIKFYPVETTCLVDVCNVFYYDGMTYISI